MRAGKSGRPSYINHPGISSSSQDRCCFNIRPVFTEKLFTQKGTIFMASILWSTGKHVRES